MSVEGDKRTITDDAKTKSSEEESERTLKQIFHLLQDHLTSYINSSELQTEKIIKIRETARRKSRNAKALTYPLQFRDQGTSITPPESPADIYCPSYNNSLGFQNYSPETHLHVPQSNHSTVAGNLSDEEFTHQIPELPTQTTTFPNILDISGKSKPLITQDLSETMISQDLSETPGSPKPSINQTDSFTEDEILIEQNLCIMRENIDLKVMMQQVLNHIKSLKKHMKYPGKENSEDRNEDVHQCLNVIDGILSKVLSTQQRSTILCDKLCEGLERINESKEDRRLPDELRQFCEQIKDTVGPDFHQIGIELGLEPDLLKTIENEYSYEDDYLHQVVLEWSRRHNNPSYSDLVSACHKVNPRILNSSPLSQEEKEILEENYNMFCEEMIEVVVIPHLVSSKIVSLKMQKYILNPPTRDQRIYRLLNVLYTRENGYDALLSALDETKQHHVSKFLRDTAKRRRGGCLSSESRLSVAALKEHSKENSPKIARRKHSYSSQCDVDSDDTKSCLSVVSSGSSPSVLDSDTILVKIYELLVQLGIPQKASS